MKEIKVVAAIIQKENKILATKRGYGEFINMWEFPGGKIESGETKEQALVREIKEELNIEINVDKFAIDIEYQYPNFYLFMSCFMCSIKEGSIELLEHNDGKWITKEELNTLNWLPADIGAVNYLKENM
ncbi:(deoxy)nucleoside triphosphate pyrophosphohydrolase [Methanobrevibacter smithii]|uniref:(deoxy)nucleoside triphosphate pyrophosphohydrolase n=1 Tax=Methanobrevibacter smithii TaxID=2173 RepID=UPI0027B9D09D|nr:(deoxy)nucleoside triphosphate pyrophosphohydrolase [Methanobrevibacter smithii]MEE0720517.1 (deoxy)nucleoside triphosphate pyrophosphohydrolase [Methanobrevibacter smithii]